MRNAVDGHLEAIREHLEAEEVETSAIERAFSALRKQIATIVADNELNTSEKADLINHAQQQLAEFEKQAKEQREAIQGGLKKITKSRRSLKSYQENR